MLIREQFYKVSILLLHNLHKGHELRAVAGALSSVLPPEIPWELLSNLVAPLLQIISEFHVTALQLID